MILTLHSGYLAMFLLEACLVLSARQHVSRAAFSSLCYKFVMGCRTRGLTCSPGISSAELVRVELVGE